MRCWVHFPVPPSRGLGLCPELLCEGLSRTTADMFPVRVASCGRRLRSSFGESRHLAASHCGDVPPVNPTDVPVNTRCIETDDDLPVLHGQDDNDLMLGGQDAPTSNSTGPPSGHVGSVGEVEALPS